eukprot:TRINITY_DN7408_c0_g1_i1.p1 TRINITY_DN7408_c0_g1~~TRINITY_DN7408_c0_g1_i1.p1  ORF type:complete len:347 (-),score=55.41 TRINITY_DN7408_c0_g1_i1:14-1054(-)
MKMDCFNGFDRGLLLYLISFLKVRDIANLRQISTLWRRTCTADFLWAPFYFAKSDEGEIFFDTDPRTFYRRFRSRVLQNQFYRTQKRYYYRENNPLTKRNMDTYRFMKWIRSLEEDDMLEELSVFLRCSNSDQSKRIITMAVAEKLLNRGMKEDAKYLFSRAIEFSQYPFEIEEIETIMKNMTRFSKLVEFKEDLKRSLKNIIWILFSKQFDERSLDNKIQKLKIKLKSSSDPKIVQRSYHQLASKYIDYSGYLAQKSAKNLSKDPSLALENAKDSYLKLILAVFYDINCLQMGDLKKWKHKKFLYLKMLIYTSVFFLGWFYLSFLVILVAPCLLWKHFTAKQTCK